MMMMMKMITMAMVITVKKAIIIQIFLIKKLQKSKKWVDINDLELKRLLNIEVNVIESQPLPVINHDSNVFNIEVTVNRILDSK